MKRLLRKLLKQGYGECLTVKQQTNFQKKSAKTFVCYLVLMGAAQWYLVAGVDWPKTVWSEGQEFWELAAHSLLWALCLALCFASMLKDPGSLKKDQHFDFYDLLRVYEPASSVPTARSSGLQDRGTATSAIVVLTGMTTTAPG